MLFNGSLRLVIFFANLAVAVVKVWEGSKRSLAFLLITWELLCWYSPVLKLILPYWKSTENAFVLMLLNGISLSEFKEAMVSS